MRKIEAIVRTNKLNDIRSILQSIGVRGMTLTEVYGVGAEKGTTISYRGSETRPDMVPRMKIEVVVTDDEVDAVLDAIFQAAHTGEIGDGRILVSPLESVTRIRTGEVDDANAIDTSQDMFHGDTRAHRDGRPSSSHEWMGTRSFRGADEAAMNYWARR